VADGSGTEVCEDSEVMRIANGQREMGASFTSKNQGAPKSGDKGTGAAENFPDA